LDKNTARCTTISFWGNYGSNAQRQSGRYLDRFVVRRNTEPISLHDCFFCCIDGLFTAHVNVNRAHVAPRNVIMALPLGHASADSAPAPIFHLCSVVLAPREQYYLINLHCIICHHEEYYTTNDWLDDLFKINSNYASIDGFESGLGIKYAIVSIKEGERKLAGICRQPLDHTLDVLKTAFLFCGGKGAEKDMTQ